MPTTITPAHIRADNAADAADITVNDEGSIVLLTPLTLAGQRWIDENLPDDCMTFGPAYVVEHRFADAILDGMICDGLDVA